MTLQATTKHLTGISMASVEGHVRRSIEEMKKAPDLRTVDFEHGMACGAMLLGVYADDATDELRDALREELRQVFAERSQHFFDKTRERESHLCLDNLKLGAMVGESAALLR